MSKKNFPDIAAKVKQANTQDQGGLTERLKRAEGVVGRQPNGLASAQENDSTFTRESVPQTQGKVYLAEVSIDLVDPNPFNARRIYIPERIKDLAASIAASGQLMPGIATLRGERYIVAAGHYRMKAIKLAGLSTIKLMVHADLTDQELYQISFKENDERTQQTPLDNALSWKDLIDKNLYPTESAIAEVTGLSLANVNKTLSILRLSEPILDLVRQCPQNYALSALYELVLLEQAAGLAPTLMMAERIGAGEAGRKEVNELRSRYETPKDRKRKESSRQYKIQIDGEQKGFIKEWDSGKVSFEILLTDPKEREILVDLLKNRFNSEIR
ncbi:MAG: ParB/RepB/Spo0J family partition protein [Pseudomonadota bacterium]